MIATLLTCRGCREPMDVIPLSFLGEREAIIMCQSTDCPERFTPTPPPQKLAGGRRVIETCRPKLCVTCAFDDHDMCTGSGGLGLAGERQRCSCPKQPCGKELPPSTPEEEALLQEALESIRAILRQA